MNGFIHESEFEPTVEEVPLPVVYREMAEIYGGVATGPYVTHTTLEDKVALAERRENEMLMLRGSIEVLWIEIGAVAHDILANKLYKYRRDEQGNYFRTAKAYFAHLDTLFKEKGWQLSRTTLYRFADDYKLFVDTIGLSPKGCQTLGKSALNALAPAVRRLVEEGPDGVERAKNMVTEVLLAAEVNGGLPKQLVDDAVSDETGRIMKSLSVEFERKAFGVKVRKLTLWWDNAPKNALTDQLTEEQAQWIAKRLGCAYNLEEK